MRILNLERLFDPLWIAELARIEARKAYFQAAARMDCREFNAASRALRDATHNVVSLELLASRSTERGRLTAPSQRQAGR